MVEIKRWIITAFVFWHRMEFDSIPLYCAKVYVFAFCLNEHKNTNKIPSNVFEEQLVLRLIYEGTEGKLTPSLWW